MASTFKKLLLLTFGALLISACGTCTEADLLFKPVNQGPPNHSLVGDVRPELTWEFAECSPTEFIINLWTNATNGSSVDTGFGGLTGSSAELWTPPADLDVGKAYIWQVAAKNGTLISPYSPFWEFIVGPACETSALIAPDPVEPIGGGSITDADPTYIWDYSDPACSPAGYALQVSTNTDFNALVVNQRQNNPIKAWTPGVTLNDCTRYYWRVAASNGPDDGAWSAPENFRVNLSGNCSCLTTELAIPLPVWPHPYQIVPSRRPLLRWTFPGSCQVGGYAVHISTEYDMSDTSMFGGTGSPSTRWTTAEDLELATQYWWEVAAGEGTDFGEFSPRRSFFTGPECSALAGLGAPELISPIDGAQVTDGFATLRYKPGSPACIPDGYFINLQTDPDFGGTNLLGEFDLPGTTVLTDPLADCTNYYWKVAAIQDGSHGPESEAEWFYTNQSGSCPDPVPPPTPTPVYSGPPMFRFLVPTFCRKGPGPEYGTAAGYEKGQEAELIGRSEPGRPPWWMTSYRCWVSDTTGETRGPVEQLLIYPAPPIPTPTLVPPACNSKLDRATCPAAGGTWYSVCPGNFTSAFPCCVCP